MTAVVNQIIIDVFEYKGAAYYEDELQYMIELLRHLAVHGTEKSFDCHVDGPRKQLVQNLDELEVGGAYYLEEFVMLALSRVFIRTFEGTCKRPAGLTELQVCVQKANETLREYIQRWITLHHTGKCL